MVDICQNWLILTSIFDFGIVIGEKQKPSTMCHFSYFVQEFSVYWLILLYCRVR